MSGCDDEYPEADKKGPLPASKKPCLESRYQHSQVQATPGPSSCSIKLKPSKLANTSRHLGSSQSTSPTKDVVDLTMNYQPAVDIESDYAMAVALDRELNHDTELCRNDAMIAQEMADESAYHSEKDGIGSASVGGSSSQGVVGTTAFGSSSSPFSSPSSIAYPTPPATVPWSIPTSSCWSQFGYHPSSVNYISAWQHAQANPTYTYPSEQHSQVQTTPTSVTQLASNIHTAGTVTSPVTVSPSYLWSLSQVQTTSIPATQLASNTYPTSSVTSPVPVLPNYLPPPSQVQTTPIVPATQLASNTYPTSSVTSPVPVPPTYLPPQSLVQTTSIPMTQYCTTQPVYSSALASTNTSSSDTVDFSTLSPYTTSMSSTAVQTAPPQWWTKCPKCDPGTDKPYHLIHLTLDDFDCQQLVDTYDTQAIIYSFLKSGLQIANIWRIQNSTLWRRYQTEKANMLAERGEDYDLKEKLLYHSSRAPKTSICAEGLDMRLSREGCFGRGIYFR